jgi:hypothetical protein
MDHSYGGVLDIKKWSQHMTFYRTIVTINVCAEDKSIEFTRSKTIKLARERLRHDDKNRRSQCPPLASFVKGT